MMNKSQKKRAQAGFSMIELIIVMVLTLVIMSAVFSLMQGTIKTANANYEMTSAAQNLRNAQEFINRDVLTVGDGVKSTPNIWLPTQFITSYLTNRTAAAIDPTNIGYTSVGAVIADNNLPAGVAVPRANPATSVLERTDRLTMLSIDKNFTSIPLTFAEVDPLTGSITIPAARIADFRVGEMYFLSNGVSATFGVITAVNSGTNRIFWRNSDVLGINRTGNTGALFSVQSPRYAMNLSRVFIIQYFVDADGKLIRRVFGASGATFIDSVIAEHLVELQFRYILKPPGDGTIFEQPKDTFDLDEATSVRMIEPRIRVKTAYPLQDGEYQYVEGATQLGVRNIQFLEAPIPTDSAGNTDLPNPGPTPQITPN
jgi:prepilin-type N-terminal cleavage/methylation domain-containing protein